MKPSTKANLLILTGSLMMMAGVFAKPLGIPKELEALPNLPGVLFFYWGYRIAMKAKATGEIPRPTDTKRWFILWVFVTGCATVAIAFPFFATYLGIHLPLPWLAGIAFLSFLIAVTTFWIGMKKA